tara:strand:- start:1054 stop:1416 length:363 start_codon:yes stop_codon:yes gene_type:complete
MSQLKCDIQMADAKLQTHNDKMEAAFNKMKKPAQEIVRELATMINRCKYSLEENLGRTITTLEAVTKLNLLGSIVDENGSLDMLSALVLFETGRQDERNAEKKIEELHSQLDKTKKENKS